MGLNIIKSVRNTIIIHEDFALPMRISDIFHSDQFTHRYCIFLTGAENIYLIGTDASQILMILVIGAISSCVLQVCLAGA